MAGRKQKPTALKILEGNPGKRPINKNEPKPRAVENLKPPNGRLSKQARRLWKDLAPSLAQLGILTEADLGAFEMLCNHYGFAVEAGALLRAEGLILREVVKYAEDGTPEAWTTRKNPAAQIFRENSTAFRYYAGEFGLTPAARARLDVSQDEEKSLAETLFELANG